MVSINKSFLYGIGFASITWCISLYLYLQLVSDNRNNFASNYTPSYEGTKINIDVHNNHLDTESSIKKANLVKVPHDKYVNSVKLIKALKPIKRKEQGLNELGMVKTEEDQALRDEGYKIYAFNVLISNNLSLNREIPDTRNKLCEDIIYPDNLLTASIIICFYNEHLFTLLRTLHSIINRTPSNILQEIVLIDDHSDLINLHSNISNYIKHDVKLRDKVKLFKTNGREGLIRARIFGAKKATGDVLIFLDSHIEVNINWIQPLLLRIREKHSNVAIPVIDIINADTFAYTSSPLVRGGFNWGLHFKWENLPIGTLSKATDFIKPIKSPTMAGGLFAIDRKYFMEMGEYDAGMDIWGGENLEISFRIWMCGGSLEILPCSRVGHVFRHRRPYGDPDGKDTMLRNSLRVANVWMDDYKDYFIKQRPDTKHINFGDVSSRIELRRRLKCYDFDWYIKNIYPELTLPSDNEERLKNKWAALEQDKFQPWHSRKRNYVDQYRLRLSNTTFCIQSKKDVKTKGSSLVLKSCVRIKNQIWYETDKSELVLAQLLCLQAGQPQPYLYKCHEMKGDQEWNHKGENKSPVYNMALGTCLGVDAAEVGAIVKMKLCSNTHLTKWDLLR